MKAEDGRLVLSLVNVGLAVGVVALAYATFFRAHHADPGETIDALNPKQLAVEVSTKKNRADELRNAAMVLDRPKIVPPPPAPVQQGPPPIDKLDSIFQVVAVAIKEEDPSRSSVILQRRNSPDPLNAQVQLFIHDKMENAYEVVKIEKTGERAVKITLLNQQSQPKEIQFTAER